MIEQLEEELRQLFAEDAKRAPSAVGLVEAARRRARRRHGGPLVWGGGALVAASVAGVVVAGGGWLSSDQSANHRADPRSSSSPAAPSSPTDRTSGAVPLTNPDSACFVYSPELLAARSDVAFDGTVTAIGSTKPKRPGRLGPMIATTFTVNEWFRGGSAKTITVPVVIPIPSPVEPDLYAPPFKVGTRLLVSGTRPYAPANYEVHVSGCGYTRYYDQATADTWRAAFS